MPRLLVVLILAATVCGGAVALPTLAQEPPSDATTGEGGVTFAPLAFVPSADLPHPADLVVERFALEPGASFPLGDGVPSAGIIVLELGTLTVRVDGPVRVTRGGAIRQIDPAGQTLANLTAATEDVRAGKRIRLKPGDAAFIPVNATGELRNDGQAAAVGQVFAAMEAAATPADPAP